MEDQTGFQPDKTGESFSQGGFQQEGFQQGGFQQGGFQQGGFQQSGFQPDSNKGFQPQGRQEVRVDAADLEALRKSIEGAKEKLQEAESVLEKLKFTPVSNNDPAFSNNGF
ncbi:hypothetical protein FOCG_01861 [Fusarium oxysporum f. sp. radicis-lycopersici 26381]|uniref:Uncharacterized protein n=1 Tax=Fusarium oxysporum f. sp. melonis 26406 TaxID=1089452 RepID=W9ZMK4_FUSOX|nr:hypothetical protein FOMG_11495 [Fusarium oxysporum f. sp. melonis 26406]EXL58307.1 hypothetical protein FOCG_01861 [Fusarium oxysporum f. sp. radicis-lycopersici 26381]